MSLFFNFFSVGVFTMKAKLLMLLLKLKWQMQYLDFIPNFLPPHKKNSNPPKMRFEFSELILLVEGGGFWMKFEWGVVFIDKNLTLP